MVNRQYVEFIDHLAMNNLEMMNRRYVSKERRIIINSEKVMSIQKPIEFGGVKNNRKS
jgi:hypothetical protein